MSSSKEGWEKKGSQDEENHLYFVKMLLSSWWESVSSLHTKELSNSKSETTQSQGILKKTGEKASVCENLM